jgi:hypothetical protein
MEILEAVVRLEARQDRSVFPIELEGETDVWPEVAAAAALVSGRLEDATTEDDLDEALQIFQALYSEDDDGSTVTPAAWKAAVNVVMDTIERCAIEVVAAAEVGAIEQDCANVALAGLIDHSTRRRVTRPGGDFSLN